MEKRNSMGTTRRLALPKKEVEVLIHTRVTGVSGEGETV